MFQVQGHRTQAFKGGGGTSLGLETVASVADYTVAQWDAGLTESVADSSPAAITNIISAPADGSSTSDWDLWNGPDSGSTDDMTFTGTAGVGGSYLASDGDQYMVQKLSNANIPSFLKDMPKTNASSDWSIIYAMRIYGNVSGKAIFNTNKTTPNYTGIYNNSVTSGDNINFNMYPGTGTPVTTTVDSSVSTLTDTLMIWTYDVSTNTFKYAANAATLSTGTGFTANTSNDGGRINICRSEGIAVGCHAGTRFYGAAVLNTFLSDSQVSDIVDWYEDHTGITFVP